MGLKVSYRFHRRRPSWTETLHDFSSLPWTLLPGTDFAGASEVSSHIVCYLLDPTTGECSGIIRVRAKIEVQSTLRTTFFRLGHPVKQNLRMGSTIPSGPSLYNIPYEKCSPGCLYRRHPNHLRGRKISLSDNILARSDVRAREE